MSTFGYKMNFQGCRCDALDFKTLMLQKEEPQGIAGEAAQSHNLLTHPPPCLLLPSSCLPGVRGGGRSQLGFRVRYCTVGLAEGRGGPRGNRDV